MGVEYPTNPNPSPGRFVGLRGDELDRPKALPSAVVHREVNEPVQIISNVRSKAGNLVEIRPVG